MNIMYGRAYHTGKYVLVFARGLPKGSCALVILRESLKVANPSTVFEVEIDNNQYFIYVFMALGPCL